MVSELPGVHQVPQELGRWVFTVQEMWISELMGGEEPGWEDEAR